MVACVFAQRGHRLDVPGPGSKPGDGTAVGMRGSGGGAGAGVGGLEGCESVVHDAGCGFSAGGGSAGGGTVVWVWGWGLFEVF